MVRSLTDQPRHQPCRRLVLRLLRGDRWRGYMLPKMASRYPRTAPALVGFLIAHGNFNAVLGALAGAAVVGNPATAAYVTGETGVFTLVALIIVAWVLVRRPATRKEDQLARDAH